MNQQNDIRKQKNKLYADLLIAIKEETVSHDIINNINISKSKETLEPMIIKSNVAKSKEISLIDAVQDSFNNLKKITKK